MDAAAADRKAKKLARMLNELAAHNNVGGTEIMRSMVRKRKPAPRYIASPTVNVPRKPKSKKPTKAQIAVKKAEAAKKKREAAEAKAAAKAAKAAAKKEAAKAVRAAKAAAAAKKKRARASALSSEAKASLSVKKAKKAAVKRASASDARSTAAARKRRARKRRARSGGSDSETFDDSDSDDEVEKHQKKRQRRGGAGSSKASKGGSSSFPPPPHSVSDDDDDDAAIQSDALMEVRTGGGGGRTNGVATYSEANWKKVWDMGLKSNWRGVRWSKRLRTWQAVHRLDGMLRSVSCASERDAALMYNELVARFQHNKLDDGRVNGGARGGGGIGGSSSSSSSGSGGGRSGRSGRGRGEHSTASFLLDASSVEIAVRMVGEPEPRYESEEADSDDEESDDEAMRAEEMHVRAEALVISKKRITEDVGGGHTRSGRFYSYDRDRCTFMVKWQTGMKEVIARSQVLNDE